MVLETIVLPLNYIPIKKRIIIKKMVEGGRFELPNPKERIYSPPRSATSLPLLNKKPYLARVFKKKLMPAKGVEPSTL